MTACRLQEGGLDIPHWGSSTSTTSNNNSSSIESKQRDLDYVRSVEQRVWPKTPFPVNEEINKRIAITSEGLATIKADALVNPTNENFTERNHINEQLFTIAGKELEYFLRTRVKTCRTGDVKVTPGFKSNVKYIIHAVPPKYKPKYKTAAETALFHAYFRIMETTIEQKYRTIVIPPVSTSKSNYPPEDNCHMQLRVIRRILEKKSNNFDMIVICIDESLHELYESIMAYYFPRCDIEEEIACYCLSQSIGGINGEPVIPERAIRITTKTTSIDLSSGLDLSMAVGHSQFSRMRDDLDKKRLSASAGQVARKSICSLL